LVVAGSPCLILGLCQGSMGAAVTDGHSGHKSDPSVAVLTPAAKGLTPMAVNVTPQNVIEEAQIRLKKSRCFSIMEAWKKRESDEMSDIHEKGGRCH